MTEFNDTVYLKDYGDGLFGVVGTGGELGDIYCVLRPVSVSVSESETIFDYGRYTVTVSYTQEAGKRTFTSWRREYRNG